MPGVMLCSGPGGRRGPGASSSGPAPAPPLNVGPLSATRRPAAAALTRRPPRDRPLPPPAGRGLRLGGVARVHVPERAAVFLGDAAQDCGGRAVGRFAVAEAD